jgi:CubicO group peptidase (beta-lactamase class C family)
MLMHGSPPPPHAQVTVANWLEEPFNRWSFWHVRELLPTQRVPRAQTTGQAFAPVPAEGLGEVAVTRVDGTPSTVDTILGETFTDALVVLHRGHLVTEWYGDQGAPDRPHLLMSVSKSIVGAVATILSDRGVLDADQLVTHYVPELHDSGYAGATVRHLLDMRSGVAFREEYTNPEAEVRQLDAWTGWRPRHDGEDPLGLYRFLPTLIAEQEHGGTFNYRSAETDVLGWVCERASGQRMADLVASLIWGPMGADFDAEFICDGIGTAIHDGGLCATARDVARFGQLILDEGTATLIDGTTHQVLPPAALHDGWAVHSDVRQAFASSRSEEAFPGGWYRNQFWFRPGQHGDVALGLGIHGQMLHVNRRTGTVCVKFSSWPLPQQPADLLNTVRAFDAVGGALTQADHSSDRSGIAGVVHGLRRHGVGSARGDSSASEGV